MSYLRKLFNVEITALSALVICASIFAGYGVISGLFSGMPASFSETARDFLALFAVFLVFAFLPVVFFGAPVYTLLLRYGLASWWSALGVGILPGMVFLYYEEILGVYALATGIVVSLLTHARFHSNLALKRNVP